MGNNKSEITVKEAALISTVDKRLKAGMFALYVGIFGLILLVAGTSVLLLQDYVEIDDVLHEFLLLVGFFALGIACQLNERRLLLIIKKLNK